METNDFLAEIYRGAKMGTETIGTILPKVDNTELQEELTRERGVFKKVEDNAFSEINARSQTPKEIPVMQKAGSYMGIQMNTMMDSGTSHIAEMLIQGNVMGVIGITKSLNTHPDADTSLKGMAEDLVKAQEDNIQKLKPFLGQK